ncbi:integrase core domain-containing protein [Halomonas salinarum]|nr:integrase core domain-containing protein [Halomonas salinarum]
MKGHEGSTTQLKHELGHYVIWYNQERPHQGLGDATLDERDSLNH